MRSLHCRPPNAPLSPPSSLGQILPSQLEMMPAPHVPSKRPLSLAVPVAGVGQDRARGFVLAVPCRAPGTRVDLATCF